MKHSPGPFELFDFLVLKLLSVTLKEDADAGLFFLFLRIGSFDDN